MSEAVGADATFLKGLTGAVVIAGRATSTAAEIQGAVTEATGGTAGTTLAFTRPTSATVTWCGAAGSGTP